MARHARDRDAIPERLARYVASEWAGGPSEWGAACRAWLQDPANAGRVLPHSADILEVRQETVRLLRQEQWRAGRDPDDHGRPGATDRGRRHDGDTGQEEVNDHAQ
jgi:hypothetical protein